MIGVLLSGNIGPARIEYQGACACGYPDALRVSQRRDVVDWGDALAAQRVFTDIISCPECG